MTQADQNISKNFARCDVGGRAQSRCQQRPCEFAGWVLVDAALSSAIAMLQLLVVGVVDTCFLLWMCGAMLQHSTCTYVSCESSPGRQLTLESKPRSCYGG